MATGTGGEAETEKIETGDKEKRRDRDRSLLLCMRRLTMGLLEGKKAVIFGVANDRSIAWAISEAFHAEGADLAFTYAGEVLEKRVRPLAESIGAKIILPCDVTKDEEIEKIFATLKQEWGSLDILIHAIAFANKVLPVPGSPAKSTPCGMRAPMRS